MTRARQMMGVLALAGMALLWGGALGATPAGGQEGGERITSFRSQIEVLAGEASVRITETIDYDFGATSRHGIERFVPVRFPYTPQAGSSLDDGVERERITALTDVTVSASDGTPADLDERDEGSYHVLRIGDPDRTITGAHRYVITYVLRNVFNRFTDHDELYLNVTGDQWKVPIVASGAEISASAPVTNVACFAGPAGSALPCTSANAEGSNASVTQGPLGPYQGLTAVVALPKGTIADPSPVLEDRSTVINALRPPLVAGAGAATLGAVGLAGIATLLYRKGRDRRFSGSAVDAAFGTPSGADEAVPILHRDGNPVEFVPPEGIRPGHLGTLWDEVAHPLDVSAMIVDLAVRGWLRIEEVEQPSDGFLGIGRRDGDYRFVRLRYEDDGLLHAESLLIQSIFREGEQVLLSDLRQKFAPRLKLIEGALYDDVVTKGWFGIRPDRVRARWHGTGIAVALAGVGLTVVLFLLSARWTLLGVVVAMLGVVLMALAPRFPARTAAGSAMLGRVRGFKELFEVGEGERQAFAERADLFSAYLPYAIVFGMAERWAGVFQSLGMTPEQLGVGGWYVSPYGYNPFAFGVAMNSFATVTTGSMAMAAPSSSGGSGFSSGGGFSGGGFGGGGGGSW